MAPVRRDGVGVTLHPRTAPACAVQAQAEAPRAGAYLDVHAARPGAQIDPTRDAPSANVVRSSDDIGGAAR